MSTYLESINNNTVIKIKKTRKDLLNDNFVSTKVHKKHKINERYAPRTPVNNIPMKTIKTIMSVTKVAEYSRFLAKINNIVANANKCPKTLLAKFPLVKPPKKLCPFKTLVTVLSTKTIGIARNKPLRKISRLGRETKNLCDK